MVRRSAAPPRGLPKGSGRRSTPRPDGQRLEVRVELKPGVLDAEAEAVEKALRLLGIEGLEGVSVARVYRLSFSDSNPKEARRRTDQAVERLLANPIIHRVEVHVVEPSPLR